MFYKNGCRSGPIRFRSLHAHRSQAHARRAPCVPRRVHARAPGDSPPGTSMFTRAPCNTPLAPPLPLTTAPRARGGACPATPAPRHALQPAGRGGTRLRGHRRRVQPSAASPPQSQWVSAKHRGGLPRRRPPRRPPRRAPGEVTGPGAETSTCPAGRELRRHCTPSCPRWALP